VDVNKYKQEVEQLIEETIQEKRKESILSGGRNNSIK
jgi:hypothetical protein